MQISIEELNRRISLKKGYVPKDRQCHSQVCSDLHHGCVSPEGVYSDEWPDWVRREALAMQLFDEIVAESRTECLFWNGQVAFRNFELSEFVPLSEFSRTKLNKLLCVELSRRGPRNVGALRRFAICLAWSKQFGVEVD